MAQACSEPRQGRSLNGSFPAPPPGFEDVDSSAAQALPAGDLQVAGDGRSEAVRNGTWTGSETPEAELHALLEGLRQAILQEVDAKVTAKTTELLQKGKQLVDDTRQKNETTINRLNEEVQRCGRRMDELEAENARLKQAVQSLSMPFHQQFLLRDMAAAASLAQQQLPLGATTPSRQPRSEETPPELLTPPQPGPPYKASTPVASPLRGKEADHSKLPEVPAFPCGAARGAQPPTSCPQSAPLSLVEALGPQTPPPQRTPLSLANSITPPPAAAPPPPPASTTAAQSSGESASQMKVTLRKVDNGSLGLYLLRSEADQALRIEKVLADGAVQAWNRQCGHQKEKAIGPGDKIIEVNDIRQNPDKMLEECTTKQLVRLIIDRASASSGGSTLRAEANVFVPGRSPGMQDDSQERDDLEGRCHDQA